MTNGQVFDTPAAYRIRVSGSLDARWADWFDGFAITSVAGNQTLLVGRVADQAALHGLLAKVRDLGLPLLYLERIEKV